MKIFRFFIMAIVAGCFAAAPQVNAQTSSSANDANNGFFQLPIIPDSLVMHQDKVDFMLRHYWDFCDLNKAFSSRDKMAQAFDTYLSFMPHATASVVYEEVPRFMKRIEKKPENVAFIGELVESKLYSDSAEFQSDELFLLFANEIIANKKLDKNRKLRYQHLAKVLSASQPGEHAPAFDIVDLDGRKSIFAADSAKQGTILFFNDPECDDCRMARLRLDTDIRTRRIIEGGQIDLVSVYPGDPANEEWRRMAASNPQEWITVASPNADELYDLRHSPAFYLLNPSGNILLKTDNVDLIISIMIQLAARLEQ